MAHEESTEPLHIINLEIENVKKVKAVRLHPNGESFTIGGRNKQGKSSCLDAVEMLIGGARTIPAEPVRHGARKARIVGDFGEFVVERSFSAKGSQIAIRGKDGVEITSPQKMLDALTSKGVALDPVAFAHLDAKKQDELLKTVMGLDFSTIDRARQRLYDDRTAANREAKRLEALLDSTPDLSGVPKEPIDVAETSAELTRLTRENGERRTAIERIETSRRELAAQDNEIAGIKESLRRLTEELAKEEQARETMLASIVAAEQALPVEHSTKPLEERLANAETVNAKVRALAERQRLERELKRETEAAATCSDTIASLDEEKAGMLAAAKFPIEGLGFDDVGPTLDGVPLAQASEAQLINLGVAVLAAQNPRIRVMLIRRGSLLDDDAQLELAKLAQARGFQVFLEKVSKDGAGCDVLIEDGEIVESTGEAAAE